METPNKNRIQSEIDILDLKNSIAFSPVLEPPNKGRFAEKINLSIGYIKSLNLYAPSKRKPEYDDLALANILANLFRADRKGKVLAYSRNNTTYSSIHKKYGYEYFEYTRYMKIINALINERLVLNKSGYYDRELGEGRNSRMKLSKQFKAVISMKQPTFELLDIDYYFVSTIGDVHYVADNNLVKTLKRLPSVNVILKDEDKNWIDYKTSPVVARMVKQLNKYNKFISTFDVVLPVKTEDIKPIEPIAIKVTPLNNLVWHQALPVPEITDEERACLDRSFLAMITDPVKREIMEKVFDLSDRYEKKHPDLMKRRNRVPVNGTTVLTSVEKRFFSSFQKLRQEYQELHMRDTDDVMIVNDTTTNTRGSPTPGKAITNRINSGKVRKLSYCKKLECRLYRVFSRGSFNLHGRFYGADYQQLSSEQRSQILINGQSVKELDFSSFHIRMIYHLEDLNYEGDPYDLYDGEPGLRAAVKLFINILINAETLSETYGPFIEKIFKTDEKDMEENEKLIRNTLNKLKIPLTELYKKIYDCHPVIRKHFHSGYGLHLMYKDSQIASDILMYFTKKKVPCLCVHDSFIVQKQYEEELKQLMIDTYRKYLGFDPVVH